MKPTVPTVLSFAGGYVDTAGYLALHGLFTAHVTGNFVTLGTTAVSGAGGALAKIAALPMFCLVVLITRLVGHRVSHRPVRAFLVVQTLLLALGAASALAWGPFPDGDSATLLVTGMILVAAMAVQNAAHRMYFASAPPTTLMTGSTTQIVIDIADRLRGDADPDLRARIRRLSVAVVAFALGCATAALAYGAVAEAAFVAAPAIALVAVACDGPTPPGRSPKR